MSARQRKEPHVRRSELVAAATALFAAQGVAETTVSDIVTSAGVAQGTFYLYFESKESIVCAVVESLIDDMVAGIQARLGDPNRSAIEKLESMARALLEISDEPHEVEMMAIFHQPDNQAIHDRVTRDIVPRLLPYLTAIIEQGVAEGTFVSEDPETTSWFVLGALQGLEAGFTEVERTVEAIERLRTFVLRGLGYQPSRT